MYKKIKEMCVKIPLRAVVLFAFMPLSVIYFELLLRLLTGTDFGAGFIFALLFALAVGSLLSLCLLLIDRPLAVRIAGTAVLGIIGVVFAVQYFIYQSFQTYMTLRTILMEARNVFAGFSDVLFSTALRGIPISLGFLAPSVIFCVLLMKRIAPYERSRVKERLGWIVAAGAVLIASSGGAAVVTYANAGVGAAFREEYNFDSSGRKLGMLPGVCLDIWYGVFGNPYAETALTLSEMPAAVPAYTAIPPEPESADLGETGSDGADAGGAELGEGDELPYAIDEPEPEPEPEPVEYGYNVLDIDFEALIENESNSKIVAMHEYVASQQPSRQNAYTGLFEGKNLIIFCAEALTKQVIDPVMTPTLYRLAHSGFYFSNFYQPAWGGGTAGGEFSILAGLPPTESSMSTLIASEQNATYTIGSKLMGLGYTSAAFHNGSFTYYQRNRSHTGMGYEVFMAHGSDEEGNPGGLGKWSASDLVLMENTIHYYIDSSPFSVYYMTYSGHAGYSRGNPMSNKNWDAFPEQYGEMSEPIRAYMAANLEFEYALEYLIGELERRGIADDTVIVVASDHYPYGLMRSETWDSDRDYLAELYGVKTVTPDVRDSSALIIWSGCLENEYKEMAIELDAPTSTLDILPTLLNLFGLEFDSRFYVGRDVFSDAVPLVFWLNRSWATEAGFYNASRNVFTPADEDAQLPDDYMAAVRSVVNSKISYARSVLDNDYFNTVFDEDGRVR